MYLTPKELTYLSDTDFLITKRKIQQKINELLVQTEERLKSGIQQQEISLPPSVQSRAGKIAKGENYRCLPYQILDFPRLFHRHDIFALRTMCWWGHYYSTTLHLQGKSWQKYRPLLQASQNRLLQQEYYLCVHANPWEYHRGEDNYRRLDSLSEQEISACLQQKNFLKIAAFLPLEEGEQLPEFALRFFHFFAELLEF